MFASRAEHEIGELRELLRAAGVPDEPEAPTFDDADARILAELLEGTAPEHPRRAPLPGVMHRPVARLALAAVAVVAIVVGGVAWQAGHAEPAVARTPPLLHFSQSDVATVADGRGEPAHDVLSRLADVAAGQQVVSGSGSQEVSSYGWYLDVSTDAEGGTEAVLAPTYQTTLLRPDGSYVSNEVRAPALDVHGNVVDGDYPPGGQTGGDELPAGTFDAQRAATLPREPSALRAALLAPFADGTQLDARAQAENLVHAVIELYQREVVAPDLAASLWTVLADEPQIATLGSTTDRLGRPGDAVGVATVHGDIRGALVVVISPDDGRLLEWDDVVMSVPELGIEEPALNGFQAFLSSRWVVGP
jgi:hypothetical protein